MGSKPRSQSCSSGLPACGGLGAHRPPTTRLSAQPFPKKGRKGRPSLATLREGTPSKGRRIISGSECQEGRVGEGSRQRLSTKVTESHVLCWPTIRVPREAGPCGLPSPAPTPPPSSPSPTINTPRPPTHPPPCFPSHPAGPRLLPTSHLLPTECAPPPPAPRAPLSWPGGCCSSLGTAPGSPDRERKPKACTCPRNKPLPLPEAPRAAGARQDGRYTCAHVHTHRCVQAGTPWRTHSALPPPTQGVWATGQGCSRVTVFGPRRGRFLPGAQAQLAC